MRRLTLSITFILAITVLGLSGCDFKNDHATRSVVEVVAVNEGAVFVDGQINAGADKILLSDDDFIPSGQVSVTLRNRDYNAFITAPAQEPYGQFNITHVQVEWAPLVPNTSADNLAAFNRSYGFNVSIAKDSEITFNVLVVTFEMKEQAFMRGLLPSFAFIDGNDEPSFQAQARVTFTGHDSGAPDHEVEIQCIIPVEFIGVIVD